MDQSLASRPSAAEPALCILGDSGIRLFGKTLPERIAVQFARAGLAHRISVDEARSHAGAVIAVRADAVLDQPLVTGLLQKPNLVLLSSDTGVPVAAHVPAADLPAVQSAMLGNSVPSIPGVEARAPDGLSSR